MYKVEEISDDWYSDETCKRINYYWGKIFAIQSTKEEKNIIS